MSKPFAYAMVEVLGAANAVIVVDQMLKTASLEVASRETSCGGHTTVVLQGDVSACKAAVDAVKDGVACDVIAAYVVSGPSDELIRIIENTGLRKKKK
jgi:microcompartment protein CcmL/EutN